jgi:hypothetical protein
MQALSRLLLLFAFAAPAAWAQTTGKIAGRVTDATTGETLPGVNVLIEGTTLGASTDFDGEYAIIGLRPGTYTLTASFVGFATTRVSDVRVSVGLTTDVDLELREEVFEGEEIVVEANAELVKNDLTSTEFRVTSEEIENLPVQEVGDILNTQAGITTSSSGLHIRGGRSSEVAYFVDGVRVTDSYDGSQSVQIENEGIEELQIIAGTYNAEYGQAMSGIINVITKDPGETFEGSFRAFSGSYVVGGDGGADALRGINAERYETANNIRYLDVEPYSYLDLNPTQYYNLQASLSGPILPNRVGFFALGRYFRNDGWLYGARLFNPDGTPGDSSLVPMNPFEKFSGQATLKARISNRIGVSLTGLGSYSEGRDFDFGFRTNPDGVPTNYDTGYNLNGQLTHTVSNSTFYTVNLATSYKRFQRYLYEDPFDPRYNALLPAQPDLLYLCTVDGTVGGQTFDDQEIPLLGPFCFSDDPGFTATPGDTLVYAVTGSRFNRGGTRLDRFDRSTRAFTAKTDVTSQITKRHLAKAGVELRIDQIEVEDYSLQIDPNTQQLIIPGAESLDLRRLDQVSPITFSAYVQDKAEYDDFIINAGLRFDYFNSRGETPADPEDPNVFRPQKLINRYVDANGDGQIDGQDAIGGVDQNGDGQLTFADAEPTTLEQRLAYWYEDAEAKLQLSPRLGIAYPISAQGVLHFSYGLFFQIPTYDLLFANPGYRVGEISGLYGTYGNPNIDPQRTAMYEIGVKQGLSDDLLVDVTAFYRDVQDWVSVGFPIDATLPGVGYVTYTNLDYSNVRGITASVSKRFSQGFSFSLDYTYQVAEGTNSSPDEAFAVREGGAEPRLLLIPLNWDQRHTFNANAFVGGNGWGLSSIARVGAGYPYTPERSVAQEFATPTFPTNAERRPATAEVDLYAFRDFEVGPVRPRLYFQVYNLFNAQSANTVYADTGRPDITFNGPEITNDDPGFYFRPDYYSQPRRVQLGMEIKF